MIKYGCMALAIACCLAAPAAQAKGNFFITGQVGQAEYDDSDFDDNSANTRALSGGYRWQAGDIAQVGIEAGFGQVDEITQNYFYTDGYYTETGRIGMEAEYRHLGVNARFNFGKDSRWFGIARGGYMAYEMDGRAHYEARLGGSLFDTLDVSTSDDDGGAYFGAGVGVDLTQNVNVNLMFNGYAYSDFVETYGSEDDSGTASTTTLGIEVRF